MLIFPLVVFAQTITNYEKAQELFNQGKYEQCISYCDKQITLNISQSEAHLLKAKAYIKLENYVSAIKQLDSIILTDKQHDEAFNLRGFCYFLQNEYQLAQFDFREACRLDSTKAVYYFNLGNVEQHMGKPIDAIKTLGIAIERKNDYAEAYSNRGQIYLLQNEFELAILDFDSALKYNQHNAELFLFRGMALTSLKQHTIAILMFKRSIRLKPNNALAYYNIGRANYLLKDYKTAILYFDTAISQKATMGIAYFNRALAKLERQSLSKLSACDDLTKAIEYNYLEAIAYLQKYCE